MRKITFKADRLPKVTLSEDDDVIVQVYVDEDDILSSFSVAELKKHLQHTRRNNMTTFAEICQLQDSIFSSKSMLEVQEKLKKTNPVMKDVVLAVIFEVMLVRNKVGMK